MIPRDSMRCRSNMYAQLFCVLQCCNATMTLLSAELTGTKIDSRESGPVNVQLSEWLWRGSESRALAQKALHSGFIKGIKSGLLDPRHFGSFFVQDAVFCFHVVQHLKIALQKYPSDSTLTAVLQEQIRTNEKYTRDLFQQWHIANPNGILLGKAAEEYVKFEREVAEDMSPLYLLIAMLPCEKLWSWLAMELQYEISATNVYRFWVDDHVSIDPVLATFIDENAGRYNVDLDTAMFIYQKALYWEGEFFESASAGSN
ncbi:uncharacterized protein LOC119737947 [Patiria miniata]|uniref:Thiaminase-2/PQQC domain-containing protein n=1 Tax=Patiria miniata TaxID=46514 RepID=A0A914AXY8_PATMI|nr:uncharacterized protein LOC119737947 [Patiria miniata]